MWCWREQKWNIGPVVMWLAASRDYARAQAAPLADESVVLSGSHLVFHEPARFGRESLALKSYRSFLEHWD